MKKYLIWFLLIALIIVRYFLSRPVYKDGDTIRLTATVSSDPVNYGNYQTFSAAGIKIYLPSYPEIFYGDKIILEGKVLGKILYNPKIILHDNFQGFGSRFRKKITDFYAKVLPQPISGLFCGVVLGSRGGLSKEFWERTKNTGVAHVVVASGTNVTFVIAFVFGTLNYFLSRRKSIPIVILSILLYLFLSGFQAPLIRASIMAFLAFLAETTGRLSNAFRVLIFTALVMLFINTDWIGDLGFLLSFVSTASIMVFEKYIRGRLGRLPKVIKESLSTSLAAQIGVAPVLLVSFGRFNILSPVINALILWTVPYIMILGSLGGVLGLAFPALGKLVLYISYPLGWWFAKIVELFS